MARYHLRTDRQNWNSPPMVCAIRKSFGGCPHVDKYAALHKNRLVLLAHLHTPSFGRRAVVRH